MSFDDKEIINNLLTSEQVKARITKWVKYQNKQVKHQVLIPKVQDYHAKCPDCQGRYHISELYCVIIGRFGFTIWVCFPCYKQRVSAFITNLYHIIPYNSDYTRFVGKPKRTLEKLLAK